MAFLDVAIADALGLDELADVKRDTSFAQSLRGEEQQDLLEGAQAAQEAAAREALAAQLESQLRLEETLAPFVGFGRDIIPEAERLFQPTVAGSIEQSPVLQSLLDVDQITSPALQQFKPGLESARLIAGADLLSRERGDLLSGIGLGQASAAQQAAGEIETGVGRSNLLQQLGNVRAAGDIAQANLGQQRTGNIVGLGTTIASAFGGLGRDGSGQSFGAPINQTNFSNFV